MPKVEKFEDRNGEVGGNVSELYVPLFWWLDPPKLRSLSASPGETYKGPDGGALSKPIQT